MRAIVGSLVALGFVLMPVRAALAGGVLATPPIAFLDANMGCHINNVATKEVTVLIEAIHSDGSVEDSGEVVLAPNAQSAVIAFPGAVTVPRFCRFTVMKGSRRSVRAHAFVVENIENTRFFLPAT